MPHRGDLAYEEEALTRRWGQADPDDYRQRFARDYDRVIHSPAFRRLQGKTQVITPGEADFFRTRLTHTLEVAQIARRLAERLGAHPDLVEAAAALHDLCHPPFGHVGEEALCQAVDTMAGRDGWNLPAGSVGGFEGNAQTFRLATAVLTESPNFSGLDLTRGTLDGAVKYPWSRDQVGIRKSDRKWCFYPSERETADWVRESCPGDREFRQSLEAQIVEWADDVAYSIHDLEDWYKAGYMPLGLLTQSDVARTSFLSWVVSRWGDGADTEGDEQELSRRADSVPYTVGEVRDAIETKLQADSIGPFFGIVDVYDGSSDAKTALRQMRKSLFTAFLDGVGLEAPHDPPRRHFNDLRIARETRLLNDLVREMLWMYVVDHPRMQTQQHGQKRIVKELVLMHCEAADGEDAKIFPEDVRVQLSDFAGDRPRMLRAISDYIAGMTDGYALRLHGRLTGVLPGAFNAFI
jgi:dGTPase